MNTELVVTMLGVCPGCQRAAMRQGAPIPWCTWTLGDPDGYWRMRCERHGLHQTRMDYPPGAELFAPAGEGV